MSVHLCGLSKDPVYKEMVFKEKLRLLLAGRNRKSDMYRCGGCFKTFETICVLHSHCLKHNEGGSYYFDHVTNTAYPKYDSKCSYAQVNLEDQDDYGPYQRILTATERSINEIPQEEAIEIAALTEECRPNDEPTSETAESSDPAKGKAEDIEPGVTAEDMEPGVTAEGIEPGVMAEGIEPGVMAEDKGSGVTAVRVRNLVKAADGLITFEMQEQHAHLFDITANAIMDRIRIEGETWLTDSSDLEVMVPNKHSNLSASTETCKDGNSGVDKGTKGFDTANTEVKDADIPSAEARDTDNEGGNASHILIEALTSKEDRENRELHKTMCSTLEDGVRDESTEVISAVLKDGNGEDVGESTKDNVTLDEAVQEKQAMSEVTSSRPVRNRKRSSILRAKEWEVHVPLKKIKVENKDTSSAKKNKRIKVNMEEIKSCDSKASETSMVKTGPNEETVEPSELTTEEASSADISASNILLSLSKGVDKPKHKNNPTEKKKTLPKRRATLKNKKLDSAEITKDIKVELEDSDKLNQNVSNIKKEEDAELVTNSPIKRRKDLRKIVKKASVTDTPVVRKGSVPAVKKNDHVCKTCGKKGTKAMVKYHKQAHSEEWAFECEVCGKHYKTRQCFSAHMRLHEDPKHKCDVCGAVFFRKQYLDTHKRKHTGEVPFVCDLCGTGFMEAYILQRHITNKHKQERSHKCDICGESFFRADTRDNHRTRHFEPTLKCAYCAKLFKAELDRRKHELTHTGEKQYFCPLCNLGFAQSWSYYRHMYKKHNLSKDRAKSMQVKNPNLVYMRNKHVEYQNEESKRERTHHEPIYAVNKVNKRVVKPDRDAEGDIESGRAGFVQIGAGVQIERDETNYELINEETDQLTDGGFVETQGGLYDEDVAHHQDMFVDSSGLPGSIVLQDGQTIDGRNALGLEDGQSVEATNISIIMNDGTATGQSVVILSDYTQTDIEDYTKTYSAVDI